MPTSGIGIATQDPNDDSALTKDELIDLQNKAEAAQRGLRIEIRDLVESRLRKEISLDQFKAEHLAFAERQAVLHSRHQELRTEIYGRGQDAKRRP